MPLVDLGVALTAHLRELRKDPRTEWLYHPRSNALISFVRRHVLADLFATCPLLYGQAQRGEVACQIDVALEGNRRRKTLDAILGPPSGSVDPVADPSASIPLAEVRTPVLSIETKACMTAHRQATTRLIDELLSSLDVVRGVNARVICLANVIINVSPRFTNPNNLPGPNVHRAEETERLFARILERVPTRPAQNDGYDGLAISVVDFDNERRIEDVEATSRVPDFNRYHQTVTRLARAYEQLRP